MVEEGEKGRFSKTGSALSATWRVRISKRRLRARWEKEEGLDDDEDENRLSSTSSSSFAVE